MDNTANNKCAMCGGKFNSQRELAQHAQQTHAKTVNQKQQENSTTCSTCGVNAKASDQMQGRSCAMC